MKSIFFILTIIVSFQTINGQIPYYDAINITKAGGLYNNKYLPDNEEVLKILGNYCIPKTIIQDTIKEKFRNNPFITFDLSIKTETSINVKELSNLAFNKVGGIDVTTFSQGLSQFMIERAKAELNAAFFDKFKEFTKKNDEIKLLFPITTTRLTYLLSYQYTEMINQLRNAFYEDLNNLPENIIYFLRNSNDFSELRKSKPEFTIFINSLELIRKIEYLSPSEFIEQLPSITENVLDKTKGTNDYQKINNLNTALEITTIFANAIRDTSKSRNWIDSRDFYNNILKDNETKTIFLGLIYQQIMNKNLKIDNIVLADTIASLKKQKIDWFDEKINEFNYLTSKIDFAIDEIKETKKNGDKLKNSQLYNYISTTIEVAEFGNQFVEKFIGISYKDYINYVKNANDIYRYTYQKEYSSAILSAIDLFKMIVPYQNINDSASMRKFSKKITVSSLIDKLILDNNIKENLDFVSLPKKKRFAKYSNELREFNAYLLKYNKEYAKNRIEYTKADSIKKDSLLKLWHKELEEKIQKDAIHYVIRKVKDSEWEKELIKYGTFMANVVEAKTPEDISNVIESTVLPVGSSSIKKYANFNVAVGGYLGANYRFNYKENAKVAWNSQWTVSAPVGISFSKGFKKAGALSLTFVLIDVGAIVDYQLSNDSSKINSKITLGNIVSPGGYLVYNMAWNLPISIGIGAQYGPGLSSIGSNNKAIINSPNWRIGAFIAVDIPFFNIYNSPKRKYNR